jgi:hypothetical protein
MALSFYFTPSSFTPAVYDETIKKLEAAGAGAPAGRLYHAALESDGKIQVFDIWDSQESFEAFGPTLVPSRALVHRATPSPASRRVSTFELLEKHLRIMKGLGADPGQPMVSPVRNIIKG